MLCCFSHIILHINVDSDDSSDLSSISSKVDSVVGDCRTLLVNNDKKAWFGKLVKKRRSKNVRTRFLCLSNCLRLFSL